MPYNRVEEYFREQLQIPVSAGSLFNFNQEAFQRLANFEPWLCDQLASAEVVHADETGINIGGQRQWLHCASNDQYTAFFADPKRGTGAMDAIGILPRFQAACSATTTGNPTFATIACTACATPTALARARMGL